MGGEFYFTCSLHDMFKAVVLFGILTFVVATSNNLSLQNAYENSTSSLICHVTMECVSTGKIGVRHFHRNSYLECSPVVNDDLSDFSFNIQLSDSLTELYRDDLAGGVLFLKIPDGSILGNDVIIPDDSVITKSPEPKAFQMRRRRLTVVGTKSVLVLRISTSDSSPSYSAPELYDFIFNETKPTLKSQFGKCSGGKLDFVPTQHGVMEVPVDLSVQTASVGIIRDAAITAVKTKFGVSSITSLADHVMFCIPPGTGNNWCASAPVNHWRTVFNDKWCGYLSGIMHEMGHNLGLLHANEGGIVYRDFTSYMSAGFGRPFYPVKCFNGANNWQFGWYNDRVISIDIGSSGQVVKLISFVDYVKGDTTNPVLLKVGNYTFLQYNRAKDFNIETLIMTDQVTIVQQQSSGTSLIDGMQSVNSTVVMPNFEERGQTAFFTICKIGFDSATNTDWVSLSIGFDSNNYCNSTEITLSSATQSKETIEPTPPVLTFRPSLLPTTSPPSVIPTTRTAPRVYAPLTTASPLNSTILMIVKNQSMHNGSENSTPPTSNHVVVASPSIMPTLQPTYNQTAPSTGTPTLIPSFAATRSPTTLPTLSPPTKSPTLSPSTLPSTKFPTIDPSMSPTFVPAVNITSATCLDSVTSVFLVGSVKRNCAWIRNRSRIRQRQCKPGLAAYEYCRALCKSCNKTGVGSKLPINVTNNNSSFQPAIIRQDNSSSTSCVDQSKAQITVNGSLQNSVNCASLQKRPRLRVKLCKQNQVKSICAKTCGSCDECVDNKSGWFRDNHGIQRTCQWLSLRLKLQGVYCRQGQAPFDLCRKTCGTCHTR